MSGSPPDNPIDQAFSLVRKQLAQQAGAERQASFEEQCILRLLRDAGVPINRTRARADCRRMFRVEHLTFMWFHHVFPGLPVKIGAAKLRDTSGDRIGWTSLFGVGFRKLPWVAEYHKMAEQCDYDVLTERVALIFNAPRADGAGLVVIHNQPAQLELPDPEGKVDGFTRIVRTYRRPAITYVMEAFSSFQTTIGTAWTTDACLP